MSRHLVVIVALVGLGACGNHTEPAAPSTPAAPAPAPVTATPAAPASAATPEPAQTEPARPRKPFEIYNGCAEVVTVVLADDPQKSDAPKRTIAAGATSDGPRDADGNQTVWLLDDKGAPLVKVRVSRGMKRVEVGRSCRTLESH